ncbi:hypothetical protein J6590_104659, partial [Homalodisca vitripennis]
THLQNLRNKLATVNRDVIDSITEGHNVSQLLEVSNGHWKTATHLQSLRNKLATVNRDVIDSITEGHDVSELLEVSNGSTSLISEGC